MMYFIKSFILVKKENNKPFFLYEFQAEKKRV